MAVTAKFVNDRIEALPNVAAALTLRLYNDDNMSREVTITPSGTLAEHAQLETNSATLQTNQIVDLPVTVVLPSTVGAGSHVLTLDIGVSNTEPVAATGASVTADATATAGPPLAPVAPATATIDVATHTEYAVELTPPASHGSSSGRHLIRLTNTGNTPVAVGLSAGEVDEAVSVSMAQTEHALTPGASHETSLRVAAGRTYWSGPSVDHRFTVDAAGSDGQVHELVGTYQQRPRVPSWLGPAAAGALAALLLGAIAWFAFLKPWVEETADQAAADAIELDRAALRVRIAVLERAAAEAEELPLGTPVDFRLDVDPAGGNVETTSVGVRPDTVVSITDLVLQNPSGAVGTVTWLRGDEILLRSELANFRDFDLHFVAPYQFADSDDMVIEVECRSPGAGLSSCPVGASLVGFVDEVD